MWEKKQTNKAKLFSNYSSIYALLKFYLIEHSCSNESAVWFFEMQIETSTAENKKMEIITIIASWTENITTTF